MKFIFRKLQLLLLFFFLSPFHSGFAAPIPGTSTSTLVSEKPQLYRSSSGFEIHAGGTSWYLQNTTTSSKNIESIFKSPKLVKGLQASMTVRVDQRDPTLSFKQYLRKSLKDYTRLGMNIVKTQPIKVNNFTGFMIDAIGQNREKQLRQIVFGKGQTMVILTCRDSREAFRSSIKECNEIFKSFTWL